MLVMVATSWSPDGEHLLELQHRWWWPYHGGLMESIPGSHDADGGGHVVVP